MSLHPKPILTEPIRRLALSSEEVAEAIGLSEREVRRLRSEKRIPTVRIGRRAVHPTAALVRWLDDLAAAGGDAYLAGGDE